MKQAKFHIERRNDKEGNPITKNVPIRMSFFIGKRLEYYTGIRLRNASNFNKDYFKTGKPFIKANEPEAGRLNKRLKAMKEKAESLYEEASILKRSPSPDYIKNQLDEYFKGKSSKSENVTVKEAFIEFLDYVKEERSYRTWQKYKTTYSHLESSLGQKFNSLEFSSVNTALIEKFRKDLISNGYKVGEEQQEYLNNTVVKYLRAVREFLNWCKDERRGYFNGSVRIDSIKENEIDVISLSKVELDLIIQAELPSKTLMQVRDVFLFGCYTGMRYGDVFNLIKQNVLKDSVRFYIQKGKSTVMHLVPLYSHANEILTKYKNLQGEKALPVLSNQKMNEYIKEVAKLAGIEEILNLRELRANGKFKERQYYKWELVSCHTARKTFISIAVEKGVSEIEIKAITGHSKNSRAFTRYFEVSEEKKMRAMNRVFGEPISKLHAV